MRLLSTTLLLCTAIVAASGCNKRSASMWTYDLSQSPEIPDLAEAPIEDMTPPGPPWVGTWQIASITIVLKGAGPNGTDSIKVVSRGGARDAVTGEYTMEPTGASTGHYTGALLILFEQLIQSFTPTDATATIDGTKWVIDRGAGEVLVYDTAISGDDAVLTYLPTDPRNKPVGEVIITGYALHRVAPQPRATVGNWRMIDATLDGVMRTDGQCFQSGGGYGLLAMNLDIDKRHFAIVTRTDSSFSDAGCKSVAGSPLVKRTMALLEESAGAFKLWSQDLGGGNPMYSEWTFLVPIMGELELTRTNCTPSTLCPGFPSKMTIGPR